MKKDPGYSKMQLTWLVILRMFIGWHFMYEGLVKITNPKWTSLPYLLDSKGPMGSFFIKLTQDASTMDIINLLNEWSLFFIGFALIAGCLTKIASVGGMLLLAIYSFSHPSLFETSYMMPFEGSYLWIDKNIVELAALGVLCVFPTSQILGIDRFLIQVLPQSFRTYKLI